MKERTIKIWRMKMLPSFNEEKIIEKVNQIVLEKDSESIEVTKNSKGNNWNIKVVIKDEDDEKAKKRMMSLYSWMEEKYGKILLD